MWLQGQGWRDDSHCLCVEFTPTYPNLNLHLSGELHSPQPGDSLRPYLTQLKYDLRLFQWLSLMGSQQVVAGLCDF